MKKIISSFIILYVAGLLFAASSEAAGYSEVSSALNSGFYPGVVEKSEAFEKQYPDSAYFVNVKLMKGEALVNMYRYEDAIQELTSIESKLAEKSKEYSKCTYLCGLAYYNLAQQKHISVTDITKYQNLALKAFYKSCNSTKQNGDKTYSDFALMFAGRIYFSQGSYEKAIQPFEYVVQNGKKYSKSDYLEILQKLFFSYNKNQNYKKTISLYKELNFSFDLTEQNKEDNFYPDEVLYTISLYVAEAYEENKDYMEAYNLYSKIVAANVVNLSVIAMKKAYLLATEQKIADSSEIFVKSADMFADNPELVCEFWTRLGIDEFNKGAYEKAEDYFLQAQQISNSFILQLYQTKLKLQAKQYETAEAILSQMQNQLVDTDENYQDSYYSTLLQTKAQLKKWSEISDNYGKIKNPDEEAKYLCLAAYYNQKKYSDCITFMEKIQTSQSESKELYASALSHNGEINKACKVYDELEQKKQLSSEGYLEYAKNLFELKDYKKAYLMASNSQEDQKDYLCGLCANNQKDFELALKHFIAYIKNQNSKTSFNKLAYFYKGYAEYRLTDWKNAYASFIRYGTEEKNNRKYLRKAYEYGAKSALQVADYKNAAIQARNVISFSDKENEKQDAILFCVEIYANIEKYNEAIDLLKPYTSENSDFGQKALYQTAKILEKQNRIKEADETYKKIYTQFSGSPLAEDAMYSAGELFYAQQDYENAEVRFNKYIYQYAKGKFLDAAFFFCGDCNQKIGNYDKAILLNKTLVSGYEKSIYLYGAYKNLLNSYYMTEDYQNGLAIARRMVEKYPTQSAADEVGQKIIELERIIGGTDKRISEKISEYERFGKTSTVKGRNAGSELVRFYAADAALQHEAYKLAKELLPKQIEDSEAYKAAQNAEFIADYEKRMSNDKEAADMYLKAAGLYRKTIDAKDNEVASALYGAVDAFKAAGLLGDAESAAELLIKLYPQSAYANNVRALLR